MLDTAGVTEGSLTIENRLANRRKERSIALLENDDHNIVSQVSLPLDLLLIRGHEWQKSGHVEHDLIVLELREHRVLSSAVSMDIKATSELVPAFKLHLVTNDGQESVQTRAAMLWRRRLAAEARR